MNRAQAPVAVRWVRVLPVALVLVVANAVWVAWSEMRTGVTETTISLPFLGIVFLLFVLAIGNAGLGCLRKGVAPLASADLRAVYALATVSGVVSGFGHLGLLTPFLASPARGGALSPFAPLLDRLPWTIGPRPGEAAEAFFAGRRSLADPAVWQGWTVPLLYWGTFLILLLATSLCLAVGVRRRWADEERLPFPALALPLALTEPGLPLLRRPATWAGFAIPAGLHSLNSLNHLIPTVPTLPINKVVDVAPLLPFPWNGVDWFPLLLHPVGIGTGYLVNADVGFSLWFFFLVRKLLNVWGVAQGWRQPGHGGWGDGSAAEFPFTGFQAWGAWLAIGVIGIAALRHVRSAHDRRAWIGFGLGFGAMCAMAWWGGAPGWLPPTFLGVYFLLMVALSRLAAETVTLSPLLVWVDPQGILVGLAGPKAFSPEALVHTGVLSWFNLDYRAAAMPHLMHSVAACSGTTPLRRLVPAILATTVVAVVAGVVSVLGMYFSEGAGTGNVNAFRVQYAASPWARVLGWLGSPDPPGGLLPAWIGVGVGAGVVTLLTVLRMRFAGFPLSPSAYALDMSWANDLFWCDLLVAWAAKTLILRYGGIGAHRKALPFFLGLALGDFVVGAAWSLFGTALGVDLYRTFPN